MNRCPAVNPNATDTTRALLDLVCWVSGERILSGQHITPRELSFSSDEAVRMTGSSPALWGQDFGFSEAGDMDGINFRQDVIDEAKRQHAAGSSITLMWHSVRPTEDEPVTFLGSICNGMLPQAEWDALLTEGSDTRRALSQCNPRRHFH